MGNACSCCSNANAFSEVEVVSYRTEAICFIETRLAAIRKPQGSTSGAETITNSDGVDSFIKNGSHFLDDVARRVKRHHYKIVKRNSNIQQAVSDTLKGGEQIQWAGAGVAVVAYVLDKVQMDKISANAQKEYIELLRFMCGLAKHINQHVNPLTQKDIEDAVVFIVKGSFSCVSGLQPSSFSGLVDEAEIKKLQSELTIKYPELGQYADEDDKQEAVHFSDLSGLDELMSYIEKRLANDKAEESTSQLATSIGRGSDLLTNVLEHCKRHAFKIMSGETRKVVIDVLKEASQIQWVGAGLSVVAYVLQKVDDASTNKEECVQFLKNMYDLAKHIKPLVGHIPEEKLHDVAEFIFKGSFFCVSRIQSTNFSRFFSSVVDVEEMKKLQSDLIRRHQDLTLEVETQVLKVVAQVSEDVTQLSSNITETLTPSQGRYPDAVGIDESVSELKKLLGMDDEKDVSTRAVVVYGVGGMGKTTLANAVFSSLDLKAYKYCHLIIKQDCSEDDLQKLQKQILNDLFGKKVDLRNFEEGHQEISKVFSQEERQPLFLFIDNALKGDDLAKILPEDLSCMPKRSRLFLTTRKLNETDMLDKPDIITRRAFPINSLPDEEAKKLLSKKVLGSLDGAFDASSDVDGLLRICGGIPLVLSLVGTRLHKHRNNLSVLNSTIDSFKDSLGKGESELTQKVVDVVYDSLPGDRHKDAFLDIAAFFSSWDRRTVSYIVGEDELMALEDAALVKNSYDRVELHDVVLKRGRKLSESDRITDRQSLEDIIEDPQRLEKVKGICLPRISYSEPKFQLQAEHLDKMHKCLRVLKLESGNKVSGTCSREFKNLRYLRDDNEDCSPMELKKLPTLSIFEGRLRSDDSFCDLPDSLRKLELSYLESLGLDESFGKLSRLEELTLSQYMTTLPQSFGQLRSLRHLNLYYFRQLTSLPNNFGQLSNLKKLTLSDCPKLSNLPDDFGQLKCLDNLRIYDCESLERLSDTFGQLSSLKVLIIEYCPKLSNLPDDFGQLKSLDNLEIKYCESLERLSDTFGQLGSLKELIIEDCSSLSSLSDDFGSLASVIKINARRCPLLKGKVLDQMIELKSLMKLNIKGSQQLIDRWKKIKDGHPQCVQTGSGECIILMQVGNFSLLCFQIFQKKTQRSFCVRRL